MASKPAPACIVWFRDDLRLADHPALHAAARTGARVVCLYVLDETGPPGGRPLGGAARWWLAQSLRALQQSLQAIGSSLLLRKGPAVRTIPRLAREIDAGAVFWNEIAQAPHQAAADEVAAHLGAIGIAARSFPGDLLVPPADIRNKEGRGLRVFTPFWKRVQALGDPPTPLPAPKSLDPAPDVTSEPLESWGLEPTDPDWAGGLRDTWKPGERSAQARTRRIPRKEPGRIFDQPRPARSRRYIGAVAAPALWRDQPAAGLARRTLCHPGARLSRR